MAQTLMAHLPGLVRTIPMVPIGNFRHNPPWMACSSHCSSTVVHCTAIQLVELSLTQQYFSHVWTSPRERAREMKK